MSRGAVAAGHPLTAEAGASVLREGGNAVDAAVAAVLTSFAAESPLTGFGAGGFMLVHGFGDDVLLDFFVEVPGRGGVERSSELVPVTILFDGTPQVFNIGAASCGVAGTPAGIWEALARYGSMSMADLVPPVAALAREGVEVNEQQAYMFNLLTPVLTEYEGTRALYAPEGRMLEAGENFRFPALGDALERYGAEGPEPFYRGEIAQRISDWVTERGGTLTAPDMAAYEVIDRRPVRAGFRERQILSNPPPSSGGLLIAYCLDLLERLAAAGVEEVVAVMAEAQAARTVEFHQGLYEEEFAESFLSSERLGEAEARARSRLRAPSPAPPAPGDQLGSTTHITVVDSNGACASVTCSNGTGSGILVPGTGVHVNNMLGEEDLNPLGFHTLPAGTRMTSMMAPTIVVRDGELEAALGSGGSNRIRSAILQTILRMIVDDMDIAEAIEAPRVHFEPDTVQAEPGVDPAGLKRLEERGYGVARWRRTNWFFGGVHGVTRDPATGELRGGGDSRRGGAVALA
jgi:gamma-glutamyltranspeptidase/glutathione hydrolase